MNAIDEFDDEITVRVVTVLAYTVAVLFGMLGIGRLHEVLVPPFNGIVVDQLVEALSRRPVSMHNVTLLHGFVLSGFAMWQICFHKQRLARLYLIGIVAAILIIITIWMNSWMTYLFAEEHDGERYARPSQHLAFIGIFLLNSCLLAALSVRLLGIRCTIWSKIRLAAFAWANGGTLLLLAQLAIIALVRGDATFS